MGRRARVTLALLWGFLVLFAVVGAIVAVVLGARGELAQATLLGAACAVMIVGAHAIERFVGKRRGSRAPVRRSTFRRMSARASRVGLAALIVGIAGLTAKQVTVIADVGVADWLRTDTTSPFEVGVVIAVLHVLLFLVAWPIWRAGEYLRARIYATRLSRAVKRPAGR
jgi:uncharacterized membrane protein YciS (DUF1049 family)